MPLKSRTFLRLNKGVAEHIETSFYNNRSELFALKKRMKSRGYL